MRKELIAHEDPKSYVSELFRTLRTNVQFMSTNKNLKSLLITSTLPGEGKTWISTNLAIAFAQTGKKVILVDADMRKCCLHNIFKVSPYPGLSNYLSGVVDNDQASNNLNTYIRGTEIENLFLLPSGNVPPNPSELLTTPQMITLLDELKDVFDLIIIDGTPSKLVTDAVILSRIVDSTIIVTGHNMTKKDELAKVIRDIKNVGGNIAGVVYNKKPSSGKKSKETYYYASTPMKIDSKKKQEMEFEKKRQNQRSRTNEMLNRDRYPQDYKKTNTTTIDKNVNKDEGKTTEQAREMETKNKITEQAREMQTKNKNAEQEKEMAPEDKATEMLKQFNEYLQKEKENINKGNI